MLNLDVIFDKYITHENKVPLQKYTNNTLPTKWNEVKNSPNIMGLLKREYLLVDTDDEFAERLMYEYVETYNVKTFVVKTERGSHFYFKNKEMDNKIKKPIRLGCYVDIKSGQKNGCGVLTINGKIRKMELFNCDDLEELDFLPKALYPMKSTKQVKELIDDLMSLDVGSRNNTLFQLSTRLANVEYLELDEVKDIVNLHNNLLNNSLNSSEIATILDSTENNVSVDKYETIKSFTDNGIEIPSWVVITKKGNTKIDKLKVVDALIEADPLFAVDDVENIYAYNKNTKTFIIADKNSIIDTILRYLQDVLGNLLNEVFMDRPIVNFVTDIARVLTAQETHRFHPLFTHMERYLFFADKVYDLKTNEIIEYTKEMRITTKIPHLLPSEYIESDRSVARLKKFLNEITQNDGDKLKMLHQLIALALINNSTDYETAFFLIGSGANGKSTFTKLLSKYVVGINNTSFLNLKQLDEKFMIGDLYNKKLNISDDLNDDIIRDTSQLKSVISGQNISVDKKYNNSLILNNKALLVFNANHTPRFANFTEALPRRFRFISFDNKFIKNGDPLLLKKITGDEAIKYLLLVAMEEASNIYEEGLFDYNEQDKITEIMIENNNVSAFVHHITEEGKTGIFSPSHSTKSVYLLYTEFIEQSGYKKPLNIYTFGREMHKLGFESKTKRISNKVVRFYARASNTEQTCRDR